MQTYKLHPKQKLALVQGWLHYSPISGVFYFLPNTKNATLLRAVDNLVTIFLNVVEYSILNRGNYAFAKCRLWTRQHIILGSKFSWA
jgi:hypothetical protein